MLSADAAEKGSKSAAAGAAYRIAPHLKALVLLYRADGRLIEAIKLVRERTGCDLRTAKYLVEHVR